VTPARNQPQLPDPVPEQPTVQHGEDPSTPVAPVLCSTPVVIRSSTLPGNFDVPSPELLKLDWVTARLYLLSGARRPEYPLLACMHHLSGAAVLDLVAGLDGTVRVVRPVKGDEVFLTAAAQAVRTWQFRPVYQRGQAARIATRIEFDFGLNE
jgi:outer membrane biosynthesis protein TonB